MPIHSSIHIHPSFCPVGPSFHPSINLIPSNFSSINFSVCLSVCLCLSHVSINSLISLPPICHLSPSHSHLIPSALSSSCTTPSESGQTVFPLLRIQVILPPSKHTWRQAHTYASHYTHAPECTHPPILTSFT